MAGAAQGIAATWLGRTGTKPTTRKQSLEPARSVGVNSKSTPGEKTRFVLLDAQGKYHQDG